MKEEKTIKFKGRLVKVLFPKFPAVINEQNPFGITIWEVLETEDELHYSNEMREEIVLKGEFMFSPKNCTYHVIAKEVEHEKYGFQYDLIYFHESIDLTKTKNQKAFLREILTESQTKEIFKTFDNPLKIIASRDIQALQQVKGIGPFFAKKILERYDEKKDLSQVYLGLGDYGLSSGIINKIIEKYKEPGKIIWVVKTTPYNLTQIDGIGFLTADKIAMKVGIHPKSRARLKAYILYYLEEEGNKGNSYITAGELMLEVYNYFGGKDNIVDYYFDDDGNITGNNLAQAITELVEEEKIAIEENENKSRRRVYLLKYYILEKNIAFHLKRLQNSENNFVYTDWKQRIEKLEEKQGFKFTEEQMNGIELGLKNQVCFISGLAGTGKSSLVSGILAALDKYEFSQCALSGRAAAQLQEVTGKAGLTIHRLLKYQEGQFIYSEKNPLPDDIIILDELSLVGGDIFLLLIRAIRSGSKLIMLGDMGQLEAIGPLNLAMDIFSSGIIPVVNLKTVHRQAQKSGILTTAYEVRNQRQLFEEQNYEGISVRGELQDIVLDISLSKDDILDKVIYYFNKYYNSELVNKDIMQIQVLSPVKERGACCVNKINKVIQSIVNPVDEEDGTPKIYIKKNSTPEEDNSYWIQKNDKVMCIKNNYKALTKDSEFTLEDGVTNTKEIFNGWLGQVKYIDEEGVHIKFQLEEETIIIPQKEVSQYIVLGYASTVHKMQGSSYPVIIGTIDYSTPPSMLTSQIVYTILTRAKKRMILIAQTGALRKAIATNFVSSKRTFLPEFLKENNND